MIVEYLCGTIYDPDDGAFKPSLAPKAEELGLDWTAVQGREDNKTTDGLFIVKMEAHPDLEALPDVELATKASLPRCHCPDTEVVTDADAVASIKRLFLLRQTARDSLGSSPVLHDLDRRLDTFTRDERLPRSGRTNLEARPGMTVKEALFELMKAF